MLSRMATLKRVSPLEAKALLDEGYVYVDVRSVPEFEDGHPAGAVNVPIAELGPTGMMPNASFVAVMSKAFAKDAKLVIGCAAGGRSARAAEMLLGAGFADVIHQRAGFEGLRGSFGQPGEPGWAASGLPVEQGAPAGRSYPDIKAKAGA